MGLKGSGEGINDNAGQYRHLKIKGTCGVPYPVIKTTPSRHVGALTIPEASYPAILRLGMFTGNKPHAANRPTQCPCPY